MGQGIYSADTYKARTASKIQSGTNFGYSQNAKSTNDYKPHNDLDPKRVATAASPFHGEVMRESRDNPDHPNANPIAIAFDVTGSMAKNPEIIQAKIKDLHGLLLRKGYLDDPQIMTVAYGDAITDNVPLQASEFESDNRIDDALDNVILEGYGGGNGGESSMLAAYFLAYHTASDAWDKRKKKGYVFFIGDEVSHEITAGQVKEYIGDGEPRGSLKSVDIIAKLKERYNVFFMLIRTWSSDTQNSPVFYQKLLGKENVIMVENSESVAEAIALTIGLVEGTLDSVDDGADDLVESGSDAVAIQDATNAIRKAGLQNVASGGAVAKGNVGLDFGDSSGGANRL